MSDLLQPECAPDPVDGEVVDTTELEVATPTALATRPTRRRIQLTKEARAATNRALNALEGTLGGREKLVEALVLAPTAEGVDTARAEYVVGLLADPKHAHRTLRGIAAISGISLQEVLTLYRKSAVQRAHLQALGHIATTLPAVAKHIMDRAIPYEAACYKCAGTGTMTPEPSKANMNPTPGPCETCKGGGKLLHEPELERQKLALTLGGLLKGGGGATTVVNVQQGQSQGAIPQSTGEGLLQMQKLSEQALYGAEDED